MNVDINDQKYLKKLKELLASEDGSFLIDFLRYKLSEFNYDEIEIKNRDYSSIGQDFMVMFKIRNKIKEILSFFDNI